MENNEQNETNIIEKQSNISFLSLKTLQSEEMNNSPLLSVDIKIKENDIKNIRINSVDEIDDKINIFCKENNIPMNAKKYIQNVIIQELNKKINQCKF
jgi:hypothetical protein